MRILIPPTAVVRRILPGRSGRATPVTMDLRAFVPSDPSAVVRDWIKELVAGARKREPWLEAALSSRPARSAFDTTAHLVADLVFDEIPHSARGGDAWQLPEETLARRVGDCEDRATLLASALVAAGISPYNVRVALGTVATEGAGARATRAPHAWVAYRTERGLWTALEPVSTDPPARARRAPRTFDYRPEFAFNGDHQWVGDAGEDPKMRARWNAFDPEFHGEVHRSIVTEAARRAKAPKLVVARLSRGFTELFGQTIDAPDIDFRSYDPVDHFDTGLVGPSWQRVKDRVAHFHGSPLTDSDALGSLCWAAHAIADFYSHSTYAHFLEREKKPKVPYDPETKKPALRYDYATDPAFALAKLSTYGRWWKGTAPERFALWKGGAISGRYSLRDDSRSFIERITNPANGQFATDEAKRRAGSLPHHDEIAVDHLGEDGNALYDRAKYEEQFRLREKLAIEHIAGVIAKHPSIGGA